MNRNILSGLLSLLAMSGSAQLSWTNLDAGFPGLPAGIHVYRSETPIDGRPNIAWYVEARLSDRSLRFDTDSTLGRRLTPSQFHERNPGAAIVVNGTFFSFADHRNLNLLIHRGRLRGYNIMSLPGRGRDTLTYHHVTRSAIGIDRQRRADVAWLFTDSSLRYALALEGGPIHWKDSSAVVSASRIQIGNPHAWRMRTAIGGGPVLVHGGGMRITNDEERMFMGKAREDLHPRTAMGYTADGRLLILAVEGRHKGVAEGASLTDLAGIFLSL
ncbi:MAG: hypothetical protein EBZ67_01580, partial [Chitinophagia bacterium]|nr:hypothetical protein [Chitinophagia bacterium]